MHFVDSEPPTFVGSADDEVWLALERHVDFYGDNRTLFTDPELNVFGYKHGRPSSFEGDQAIADFATMVDIDAREVLATDGFLKHRLRAVVYGGGTRRRPGGKEVEPGVFEQKRGSIHLDSHDYPAEHGNLRYLSSRIEPTEILVAKFLIAKEDNVLNDVMVWLQMFSRHVGQLQFQSGDVVRTKKGQTMHRAPSRLFANNGIYPDFTNDIVLIDDVTAYSE